MAKNDFDMPIETLTKDGESTTLSWSQWFGRIHTICTSLQQSGTSAQRPTKLLWIGRRYFDTTLGMPIWVTQVTPTVIWSGATGSAYAEFSSSASQTIANIALAQAITFNTTDIASGISIVSSTRITPAKPGIYSLAFNAQAAVSVGSGTIDFWLRRNGTDVTNSTIRVTLSGPTDNLVAPQPYVLNVAIGDYFEIIMAGTSVNCGILAVAAGGAPARPAIPSIIVVMNLDSTV